MNRRYELVRAGRRGEFRSGTEWVQCFVRKGQWIFEGMSYWAAIVKKMMIQSPELDQDK